MVLYSRAPVVPSFLTWISLCSLHFFLKKFGGNRNKYVHLPEYSTFKNEVVVHFNPLLMVKDFNNTFDLKSDNSFMTNADVPFISTKELIPDAKNPFTGKRLAEYDKSKGVDVYMDHKYWNISHFTSNKVILNKKPIIKHVKDNIFEESNWKDVGPRRRF